MSANFNRVIISGLLAGVQTWSVTPAFAAPAPDAGGLSDYNDLEAWAQAIGQLHADKVVPNNILGILTSAGTITKVRTEWVMANGTLVEAAEYALPTPASGSAGAINPLQTSVVASLVTGRPGRSYAGRIYWPGLGAGVTTDTVRLPTSTVTGVATDTATWLEEVANAANLETGFAPVVVSTKMGIQTPITQVRVGNVADTQRRRRDKQVEQYTSVSLS